MSNELTLAELRAGEPGLSERLTNPVYESLTEVEAGIWKVRVWRGHDTLASALRFQHDIFEMGANLNRDWIESDDAKRNLGEFGERLMSEIAALPRVSCVQIADNGGDGAAYFPDWP